MIHSLLWTSCRVISDALGIQRVLWSVFRPALLFSIMCAVLPLDGNGKPAEENVYFLGRNAARFALG
jgi:hypothetical protein